MRQTTGRKSFPLAPVVFLATLWFFGCFFFLGNLGKWADDWSVQLRDPINDSIRWKSLLFGDPLQTRCWRLFHVHACLIFQTLLWHQDWLIHLLLALLHGVNAWLLWKILQRVCRSRQAPIAGAILFLVYPAGYEAIFWLSTIGTSVGTTCLLLCALSAQRLAAGEISLGRFCRCLPLLVTLGLWYEQPAAAAPAIALAYLACAPSQRPMWDRVKMAGGLAMVAMLAAFFYVGVTLAIMPPSARASVGGVAKPGELPGHALLILNQAWDHLRLTRFRNGGLEEGWRALRAHRPESIIVGIIIALTGFMFSQWWMRGEANIQIKSEGKSRSHPDAPGPFQRTCAFGFGLAVFVASLVPVIAVRGQWFASRLSYLPVLGLAVILATLLDLVFSSAWTQSRSFSGRVWRGSVLAALLFTSLSCAVMLVAVQSLWHKRMLLDRSTAQAFLAKVPHPPLNAVFVPLNVSTRPTQTKGGAFERLCSSPFEQFWPDPATAFVQTVYHRSDLTALGFNEWREPKFRIDGALGAVPAGLALRPGSLPQSATEKDGSGRTVILWSHLVAFSSTPQGTIRVFDELHVEDSDDPMADFQAKLTAVPHQTGAQESFPESHFPALGEKDESLVRPQWRLTGQDGRLAAEKNSPQKVHAGSQTWPAYLLHPAIASIPDRCELRADIGPFDHPRTVAMRMAMEDGAFGQSDGVVVSLDLEGRSAPLVQVPVTPEPLQGGRGWIVVHALIPACPTTHQLRVVVTPGPAGNANSDWCLITPPVLSSRTAAQVVAH